MVYLIYRLKNEQTTKHLLDVVDNVYNRLEPNPAQFPVCRDAFLQRGSTMKQS